jgi:hypothetical protein
MHDTGVLTAFSQILTPLLKPNLPTERIPQRFAAPAISPLYSERVSKNNK